VQVNKVSVLFCSVVFKKYLVDISENVDKSLWLLTCTHQQYDYRKL